MMNNENKTTDDEVKEMHFNGAALVDKCGREVIITEDMIQRALVKLIDASMLPREFR